MTPGYQVWRLATKWRVAVDRAVAPHGLTHAKYAVLATLYGLRHTDPELQPSQRRLADLTGLEPLYVSKLVRSLEASGLVDRHPDPADTRAVRLDLTDQGFAAAAVAVAIVHGLLERLLAPLGGLDSARTAVLSRELRLLLDNPLDVPLDNPLDVPLDNPLGGPLDKAVGGPVDGPPDRPRGNSLEVPFEGEIP